MSASVERFEDMSPQGRLVLHQQPDGDLIITIVPDPEDAKRHGLPPLGISAEFCAVGGGGGQSPHTRKAIIELWRAIERDNAEHPQHRE